MILAYLFLIFGFFFLIRSLLFFNCYDFILGIIPIIIGFYFKNRIVGVFSIEDDRVTFLKGDKEIHILKDDIISVAKNVRFTITEHYWLTLTYRNKNNKKGRYFFTNESGADFLGSFKAMGVELKNVP